MASTAVLPSDFGDPTVVKNLIAEHIIDTTTGVALPPWYLAQQISEITVETQTLGPALLSITLIDPRWTLQRSGLCDKDQTTGKLKQRADINFPEGTDVWWRLAMIEGEGDLSQPNLVLTFQHRIISYLMNCWGPLGWPHGQVGSTRAQFIKYLCNKMPSELPAGYAGPSPSTLTFICPDLNIVQPVASSNVYGTEVVTAQSAAAQAAGINKLPGLTAASAVAVLGGGGGGTATGPPNATQIANINTILGVGQSLAAPAAAMVAAMYAAMGESHLGRTSTNVFQVTSSAYSGGTDLAAAANGFFTGGPSFGNGGAIKLAKAGHPAVQIANAVEVNKVYIDSGGSSANPNASGDSYGGYWPNGSAQGLAQAQAIVNAFSGGLSGVTASPESDIATLTRGTPDNPDEDSWTCMQRLASEVNWMIWSDPQPVLGKWGNYLYYMDGVTAVAQTPSVYISLDATGTAWTATDPATGKVLSGDSDGVLLSPPQYTIDNTSFQAEQAAASAAAAGAQGGSKVQKQTGIQTPQTPAQVQFNMLAGVMEFNAGQVAVFQNAGPLNGRWIIEDVTHNTIQDLFAQFTLGPPVYAYPEPQSGTETVIGANGQPVTVSTGATSSTSPTGTTVSPTDISGYTNPLAKVTSLTPHRIDQGVDYGGQGPLVALGNGTVTYSSSDDSGWPGGGAVVIQLADGPYKGKYVYYCEDLTPSVSVGATVTAGQAIATLHDPSISGLEIGWASGSGSQPLAQQLGQNAIQTGQGPDPGDCQSAAGRNFNTLLVALGATSGGPGSGPLSTGPGMPASWPALGSLTTKGASGPTSGASNTGKLTPQQIAIETNLGNQTTKVGGMFTSLFGS